MYIATLNIQGVDFFLKGTTWAFNIDRADKFSDEDSATAAILKAQKFMKKSMFKKIIIKGI